MHHSRYFNASTHLFKFFNPTYNVDSFRSGEVRGRVERGGGEQARHIFGGAGHGQRGGRDRNHRKRFGFNA